VFDVPCVVMEGDSNMQATALVTIEPSIRPNDHCGTRIATAKAI